MGGLELSAFAIEKIKIITWEDEEWRALLPSQGIEDEDFLDVKVVVTSSVTHAKRVTSPVSLEVRDALLARDKLHSFLLLRL